MLISCEVAPHSVALCQISTGVLVESSYEGTSCGVPMPPVQKDQQEYLIAQIAKCLRIADSKTGSCVSS
jgi:hypothetical protein